MNWNPLESTSQLDMIDAESVSQKIMIFKHSTRCGISLRAKGRLDNGWKEGDEKQLKPYYLDLLAFRHVSDAIAERYGVPHESPQVLIISNGKCIFSSTHSSIDYDELMSIAAE